MNFGDAIIIVAVVIGLILTGLYFLNKWAAKKGSEQQAMIDRSRTPATIYVIDKKRDKAANINLPKAVMDSLPKVYKVMKMNFVKAKVGAQIVTLVCDKKIFDVIPVKKNVKVELAGIYIISLKGIKTEEQKKKEEKEKKAKEKSDKQLAKQQAKL